MLFRKQSISYLINKIKNKFRRNIHWIIRKLFSASDVKVSDYGRIEQNVKIEKSIIKGFVIIEEKCKIVNGVEINTFGTSKVEIGRFTSITGPNTVLLSAINNITIGSFCSIARGTQMQEYNHNMKKLSTYFISSNLENDTFLNDISTKGNIEIGHDVWIGGNAFILSGVSVGTGAVVAAGAIVTKDVPSYAIVAGNPAKIVKYRFNEEIRSELLQSQWWLKDIGEIVKIYAEFDKSV